MGIAGNYGIDSSDVEWAAEQGANYWVWGASFKKVTAGIKDVIRKNREKNVVALLGWGFFGRQIRQSIRDSVLFLVISQLAGNINHYGYKIL